MNSIAALLNNLSISQNSYNMIKSFNQLSGNQNNVCCFYHNLSSPPVEPLFAMMNIYYLNLFKGSVIATSLHTAQTLLNLNTKVNKYLYLWDLEWLTRPVRYEHALNILTNKDLKIIARSESHAKVIENFCNKKVCGIVDNWESEKLLQIIGDE